MNECEFDNITVLTYHKLLRYFSRDDDAWFSKFYYVVLDECHFFYSDALFNPHTGYILEMIVKKFSKSIRIYMSATFEEVLDPICSFERQIRPAGDEEFTYKLVVNDNEMLSDEFDPFAYRFPFDYSRYKRHYFSDFEEISTTIKQQLENAENIDPLKCKLDQISNIIEQKPEKALDQISEIIKKNSGKRKNADPLKKDKWLIFVTSKEGGNRLKNEFNQERPGIATFIDAGSKDVDEAWRKLMADGSLPSSILITTSVLDNGFSIKDDTVKNIAIMTDDKTECLQELGRCRLDEKQEINLYIQKLTGQHFSSRKNDLDRQLRMLGRYFGVDRDGNMINSDPESTIRSLWTGREDQNRNAFSMFPVSSDGQSFRFEINMMFCWRVKRTRQWMDEFEKMMQNDPSAEILFKEKWFGAVSDYIDIDRESQDSAVRNFMKFLNECVDKDMTEESYKKFSKMFVDLFKKAFPGKTSFNRSQSRINGAESINNHLQKIPEGKNFKVLEMQDKHFRLVIVSSEESKTDESSK